MWQKSQEATPSHPLANFPVKDPGIACKASNNSAFKMSSISHFYTRQFLYLFLQRRGRQWQEAKAKKPRYIKCELQLKFLPLFYCHCFYLEKFQQNLRAIFYISILYWPETFYSTILQFLNFVSDSLKAPNKILCHYLCTV